MRKIETSERSRKRLRLAAMLCATAMTAPFATTAALAAEETEDSNTIIVNANKRDQAIEDVAGIVQFLEAESLATNSVTSVRDLANVTTGFQLGNAGSIPQVAIRGVTTINAGSYENNVAVFIDGIYQAVPVSANIDLPNISNIQILKGPQGTLYGRNATGGAVLISTIDPTDEWVGQGEITYARYDDKRIGAYLAGPLSDRVGFAVSTYWRKTDGYYKKVSRTVVGETDGRSFGLLQGSIRAKLHFDLTDSFRAKFAYAFTKSHDPRGVFFTQHENATTTDPRNPHVQGRESHNYDPHIEAEQHEGSFTLELDTGIGQLKTQSAYSQVTNATAFDFDGTYRNPSYSISKIRDKTYQQSVDLTIDAIDNLDLIIGGTYYNIKTGSIDPNKFLLNLTGNVDAQPSLSTLVPFFERPFFRTKEAYAAFIDATFHVTDRISINAGGRYSTETQRVHGIGHGFGGIANGALQYDFRFSNKYKKFTPRGSITFEVMDRTNIYLSYSQGFRSGESNSSPDLIRPFPLDPIWNDADQETIDAFEIGIKHGGDRLSFELAGFYYDYKNLQVSVTQTVPAGEPGAGSVITRLQNAPKARIYGVEGSLHFEVMENFNINAGFTYLNARYGKGFIFSGTGINPNVTGTSVNSDPIKTRANIGLMQDLSGLQMSRAPDFTAYLGFDYRIPNEDGGIVFAANAKYTSSYVPTNPSIWGGEPTAAFLARKALDPNAVPNNLALLGGTQFADRANESRTRTPGYVLLNASITWSDPTDTYYVRAWGKNLTNEIFPYHYNPIGSGTYIQISEPRTYGLTLGVKLRPGEAAPPPAPPPPPPPAPTPPPPPPMASPVCNKGPFIVFFDWDQSAITSEAAMVLDSAVAAYPHCDRIPVMLAGHADRSGSARYNVGLSERRNGEVNGYLTARGIPAGSITSQAFGESQNRVPTADGVRELQNRRVEVTYGPGSGW